MLERRKVQMLDIEGVKDTYILDFNEDETNSRILKINSSVGRMTIPWNVYYTPFGNDVVSITMTPDKSMKVVADLEALKTEGSVIITNPRREKVELLIKPNKELSREKEYVFKMGKYSTSGDSVTINIISKENGKSEPWHIKYDGKPLDYDISVKKSKMDVKLLNTLETNITSVFILEQDRSGKEIEIELKHNKNESVDVSER